MIFSPNAWPRAPGAARTRFDHLEFEHLLHALPGSLRDQGTREFNEGMVYRWLRSISALPGGHPQKDLASRHVLEPHLHHILVVGDYLFDSTLNGVMDSADCVTDMLLSRNLTQRRPRALGIRCDYFDLYEGKQYEDAPLGANFGPSNHHLPTPGRGSL